MTAGEMEDQDFTEFLSRSITGSLPYMDTTALYYLFMDLRHVGNLNAAVKRNGLIQQNHAFGLRPTQASDRFIDHNMNLSVSTVAMIASKTISSLGVPGAIAPMCGSMKV